MLLVLLSQCAELLISAPKIITLLPSPPLGCEKVPLKSNPVPYPEYLHLSISAFFVNLTAPNRHFSKIKPPLITESNLKKYIDVYYWSMIVCNFILL